MLANNIKKFRKEMTFLMALSMIGTTLVATITITPHIAAAMTNY